MLDRRLGGSKLSDIIGKNQLYRLGATIHMSMGKLKPLLARVKAQLPMQAQSRVMEAEALVHRCLDISEKYESIRGGCGISGLNSPLAAFRRLILLLLQEHVERVELSGGMMELCLEGEGHSNDAENGVKRYYVNIGVLWT